MNAAITEPKRLLIYSDRGGVYGAEQINHRLALGLHAAGLRVTLAQPAADNPLVAERTAQGIGRHWLPDEDPYDWQHPAPSLTDPGAAQCCLAEVRPDLILFADSFPFANLAARQAAVRGGIPYLTLIHCVQPGWADRYREFLPALARALADAAAVVAVSAENLDLLRRHFGLRESTGQVICNGRPEVYFAPRHAATRQRVRAALGIPDDAILAASVGRLDLVKGWPYLLDALRLLHGCPHWARLHLLWVGSGPLEGRLRQLGALLGQGRVHLLTERNDVPDLLEAADLLVHPAQFEGMPLVVLEAMAKGLPVIATAVSGIPEALGETGVLLDAATTGTGLGARLAAAICVLAGDAPGRARLGTAAHHRALERFTEARMLADWLTLIRRVISRQIGSLRSCR